MGQVLEMTRGIATATTPSPTASPQGLSACTEVAVRPDGLESATWAQRRRLAARERSAAQARRVARAAVEGSLSDLELTRRGRWVLWSTAIVVASGMAVMGGGALASTPELPHEMVLHVVTEGENLWGLAESIALPGEDLRDVVELIIEVNGRATASLWAGEQIVLPVR